MSFPLVFVVRQLITLNVGVMAWTWVTCGQRGPPSFIGYIAFELLQVYIAFVSVSASVEFYSRRFICF